MTAPDPLPAATRVRKARRSSRVSCGHYVLTDRTIERELRQLAAPARQDGPA